MDGTLAGLTLAGLPALFGLARSGIGVTSAAAAAGLAAWIALAFVVRHAVARAGLARCGWANRVTLLRGLLACLLVPLLLVPLLPAPASQGPSSLDQAAWWPFGLGAVALALDGADGALARRHGMASAFGARFDMETDALTVLVLSALVAVDGRVGAWVLLSGALRYLYVAVGRLWPALRRPPPPSFARKLVCVLQIAGLLAALAPALEPPWPSAIAAAALALLLWSFGRDTVWLLRDRGLRDGGMAESSAAPYLNDIGGV